MIGIIGTLRQKLKSEVKIDHRGHYLVFCPLKLHFLLLLYFFGILRLHGCETRLCTVFNTEISDSHLSYHWKGQNQLRSLRQLKFEVIYTPKLD